MILHCNGCATNGSAHTQDEINGKNRRVMNLKADKTTATCTVCGATRGSGKSAQDRFRKKK